MGGAVLVELRLEDSKRLLAPKSVPNETLSSITDGRLKSWLGGQRHCRSNARFDSWNENSDNGVGKDLLHHLHCLHLATSARQSYTSNLRMANAIASPVNRTLMLSYAHRNYLPLKQAKMKVLCGHPIEEGGPELPWSPSMLVASVSESVGARRRQWLQVPKALGPQLVLPGHILARMRNANRGGKDEVPILALYHGLYRSVVHMVAHFPGRQGKKDQQSSPESEAWAGKPSLREAERVYEKGASYEKAMDIQSAIACFERACFLQPHNLTYLARLSKQWSDLSFAPGVENARARELNQTAMEIAEKILLRDPKNALGSIGLCVSKGRLAYFSDTRTKVHLAREAEEVARKAVILHPQNDLIHHLLGRWHYEMAGLNVIARAIVRIVYGTSLPTGTYQGALVEFEEATRLAPNRLIHYVEVGKAHWKLGNRDQAIDALESAMELEVTELNDFLEAQEGARLLKKIQGVRRIPAWDFRLSKVAPARPIFFEER